MEHDFNGRDYVTEYMGLTEKSATIEIVFATKIFSVKVMHDCTYCHFNIELKTKRIPLGH